MTGSVDAAFDADDAEQRAPPEVLPAALVRLSSEVRTRAALAHELGARHAAVMRARIAALLERAREEDALRQEADVPRLARTVQVTDNGALISWGISGRGKLSDGLRDELDAVLSPWR